MLRGVVLGKAFRTDLRLFSPTTEPRTPRNSSRLGISNMRKNNNNNLESNPHFQIVEDNMV